MKKTIAINLGSVFLLLLAASGLGAAWTTKRLTNNAGKSRDPAVAASGANVFVVWADDTPGNSEILFRRSLDNGATWKSAMQLTNTSGYSDDPTVALSGANVYVVWEDETPGNSEIYFLQSSDSGATWKSAKRLTNNAGDSEFPRIAARGGNIYVMWVDDTPGNEEIFFRRSPDYGATWQSAKRMTNSYGYSAQPGIAADGANVYLSWYDDTTGSAQIYFRRSANWGLSWEAAKQVSSSGSSSDPAIAAAGDGATVYLAGRSDSTGNQEIHFIRSDDNGATWGGHKQITHTAGYSNMPSIAASGDDVYLVWMDDTATGSGEVYFRNSADKGANWGAAQRLTFNTTWSDLPKIAAGETNVFVAYYDSAPGNLEVFLKYSQR